MEVGLLVTFWKGPNPVTTKRMVGEPFLISASSLLASPMVDCDGLCCTVGAFVPVLLVASERVVLQYVAVLLLRLWLLVSLRRRRVAVVIVIIATT